MSHMKQHERQKLKYLEKRGEAMGYTKSKYSMFPTGEEEEEVEECKNPFVCKICQSGFPTKPLFSQHFDEVHSKDYPLKVRKRRSRDAPPKEPKPKKNRENTIAHNYLRLYVCDTGCGHEFSTVPQLVDHMTEEHQVEYLSPLNSLFTINKIATNQRFPTLGTLEISRGMLNMFQYLKLKFIHLFESFSFY